MEIIHPKQYFNYIVLFDDGTIKMGATSRPKERIKEIGRARRKYDASPISAWLGRPTEKSAAFAVERKTSRLMTWANRVPGTREWFTARNASVDIHDFKNTMGMFWCLENPVGCGGHEFKEVSV